MPITLQTWLDRTSIRPEGTSELSAVFEIAANGSGVERTRARARTVLALDVSGSMKGEPLAHVIKSVDRILDAIGEDDEVGIVAFSNDAREVVNPIKCDAFGRRIVRSRAVKLRAEHGTNIEAGIRAAAAMAFETPPGMRRGVILLSDGAPTVGVHTAEGLRAVAREYKPGISFFSLGYGHDHSEDVLSAIGDGYEFVPDPATCARAFARALGAQGDVVASEIELVLAPATGVELVRFVGKEQTRFAHAGVVVALPDMVHGGRRVVVAELRVKGPGADKFATRILDVTARCKGQSITADLTVEIADREPAAVAEAARRVLLVRAEEAREEARALADRGNFSGAGASLQKVMAQITALPGFVANDGSPLAEAYELLVDETMVYARRPDPEQYAMYRKAAMSSRLGTVVPQAAKSRGAASSKLIMHVAGDCPVAWLVNAAGARHRLEEECVIGRTKDADICVPDTMVSRRHAEIFANEGDYWVCDLGSTNPTIVNGERLGRAPHKLVPGDVVRIGETELRYEEAARAAK